MNALHWRLRRMTRMLGRTGIAGVVLLALALLLHTTRTAPLQRAVDVQQDRLAALRQAAVDRRDPAPAAAPPVNPLALLPPAGEAAQQIGELEHLARAHGLTLARGQYSMTPLAGIGVQRWQLTLPIAAPYPALHAFIAAALERQPNLALDELKLKRERIESTELDAELRLSLFAAAAP